MNTLYDNIYDVIFAPHTAFRRIAAERPIGQAAAVFMISTLVPIIPMYFVIGPAGLKFAAGALCSIQLIGSLLVWFLSAAVWALIAEFFGGNGRGSSLFISLGFSHIPRMLMVPVLVVISLLPYGVKQLAEIISFLGIFGWSLYLDAAAIRETYDLSGAKAVLVLTAPLLLGVIFMVLAGILIGTMLIDLPSSFNNVLVE